MTIPHWLSGFLRTRPDGRAEPVTNAASIMAKHRAAKERAKVIAKANEMRALMGMPPIPFKH